MSSSPKLKDELAPRLSILLEFLYITLDSSSISGKCEFLLDQFDVEKKNKKRFSKKAVSKALKKIQNFNESYYTLSHS